MNGDLPDEFLIELRDDSMAPLLRLGHVVRFDKRLTPRPGDCVLVRDPHGVSYVRNYVERRPGLWLACATNAAYESLESARDELTVIAVFTGMQGRLG